MNRYFIAVVISIAFANYSYAQTFSLSAFKQNYNLNDTIQLKLVNLMSVNHYLAIGMETKVDNKWEELEPTINQIGKTEIFEKTKNLKEKIINVVLPNYLKNMSQKDTSFYIRFRLTEGQSLDNLHFIYSLPVLIGTKNS